jgi:hypothetical protein
MEGASEVLRNVLEKVEGQFNSRVFSSINVHSRVFNSIKVLTSKCLVNLDFFLGSRIYLQRRKE